MKVKVRFFARCREIIGDMEKELEVLEGMRIRNIIDLLISEYPKLKEETLIVSRNHKYTALNTKLKDNDVVAVFPPVGGG